MSKVGIIAYGVTPFTKEDHKIESTLHKSTNNLFQNNPNINKKEIDAVLVSTNNNCDEELHFIPCLHIG